MVSGAVDAGWQEDVLYMLVRMPSIATNPLFDLNFWHTAVCV